MQSARTTEEGHGAHGEMLYQGDMSCNHGKHMIICVSFSCYSWREWSPLGPLSRTKGKVIQFQSSFFNIYNFSVVMSKSKDQLV